MNRRGRSDREPGMQSTDMQSTNVAVHGGWRLPLLRVAGAGLLVATAAIHLDLYLTGYRNIPTIGWLFLLQVIAGFALGAAVLATGNQVVAALGAGFAVSTLGGYLLSIWIGLFGFTEVRTTAGIVAGIIEVAAFAVLALLAVTPATAGPGGRGGLGSLLAGLGKRLVGLPLAQPAIGAASVVALVLLLVAVAGAGGKPATGSGGTAALKTGNVGGVTVLTNANGLTVYTFAADTPGKSNCNGSCAVYWPPVTGTPSAPGVPGTFSTTTRTGGIKQVTWNGHPLYTYVGDHGPGQANGNNLNLNGGLWKDVVVHG
jgi:predicted lipoprotein with Yx(FWY)xxD motif